MRSSWQATTRAAGPLRLTGRRPVQPGRASRTAPAEHFGQAEQLGNRHHQIEARANLNSSHDHQVADGICAFMRWQVRFRGHLIWAEPANLPRTGAGGELPV